MMTGSDVSPFGGFPFLPGSGRVVSLPDKGAPTTARIEVTDLNAPVDVAFEGPHSDAGARTRCLRAGRRLEGRQRRLLSIDLSTGKREVVLAGVTRPVSVLVIEPGAIAVSDLGGNLYFLNHR